MNITTNGQTVPANSGFYLINNVVEQNINSTIINNISTNTYYFDKDGSMLTNATTPDGYAIGPDGR